MAKTKGAHELSQAQFGGILEAKNQAFNECNRRIAKCYKCSESSVRNMAQRAADADKENIDPFTPEACTAKPRSGRPFAISPRNSRRLIRQATKNKYQRRKDWVTIAREIGINASPSAINSAFHRAGYGRYPPRYKPQLNTQQKNQRLNFCTEWVDKLRGKEHQIVFCDEMTIRAGERRGQMWITRTEEEAYHPDCIESRFSAFTELMFWGCYTMYRQGPRIIFDKETQEEKEIAQEDITTRNGPYHAALLQEQARLADENSRRPPSRQLKRPRKPNEAQYKRGDRSRGGIDWYRYQEQVIKPHLVLFIKKIIRTYGHCYLVQDGAPAHNAWPQSE